MFTLVVFVPTGACALLCCAVLLSCGLLVLLGDNTHVQVNLPTSKGALFAVNRVQRSLQQLHDPVHAYLFQRSLVVSVV